MFLVAWKGSRFAGISEIIVCVTTAVQKHFTELELDHSVRAVDVALRLLITLPPICAQLAAPVRLEPVVIRSRAWHTVAALR